MQSTPESTPGIPENKNTTARKETSAAASPPAASTKRGVNAKQSDSPAALIATTIALILCILLTVAVVSLIKSHSREAKLLEQNQLLIDAARDESDMAFQYVALATNGALFQVPRDQEADSKSEVKLGFNELMKMAKARCLRYAIQQGHLRIAEKLFAENVTLFISVEKGSIEEDKSSEEVMYDASLTNNDSLLDLAASGGQKDSTLYVLHLANLLHQKLTAENGMTLKTKANVKKMLEYLVGKSKAKHERKVGTLLNIDVTNSDCQTPIMAAAKNGQSEIVQLLLKGRGSLTNSNQLAKISAFTETSSSSDHQHPALRFAETSKQSSATNQQPSISPMDLRNKEIRWNIPNINQVTDKLGHTALHLATGSNSPETVKELLDGGALATLSLVKRQQQEDSEDHSSPDKCLTTIPPYISPLHIAVQLKDGFGQPDPYDESLSSSIIAKLLMSKGGADALLPDPDFQVTPLDSAIQHGSAGPLRVMLEELARNQSLAVPSSVAPFTKLQLLFVTPDQYGATLLNRAVVSGRIDMVKLIFTHIFPYDEKSTAFPPARAAAINRHDGNGWGALHTVPFIKEGAKEMLSLIITEGGRCPKGIKGCHDNYGAVNINIKRGAAVGGNPTDFERVVTPLDMAIHVGATSVADTLQQLGAIASKHRSDSVNQQQGNLHSDEL